MTTMTCQMCQKKIFETRLKNVTEKIYTCRGSRMPKKYPGRDSHRKGVLERY